MIKIQLVIINRKDLEYVNEYHGLIIYCKDTKETYYINQDFNRVNISFNTIFLKKQKDLENIISPILSRVYITEEDSKIFKYTNKWVSIETEEQLLDIVEASVDYVPSVLMKDDKFYAPKTLASSVYMQDGTRLSSALDRDHLAVTKTKAKYVEAEVNRQRIFNIPYPITNYDLCRNHVSVIVRGKVLETNNYVINNHKLILNSNFQPLDQGELILFIFYYTTILDLNENVVLTTKNYEDKSITTEKLSENIAIKATNILETPKRYFLTPEEREKLNDIDYGATRYIHPDTHPASMITEDDNRNFISKQKLQELDDKAFSRDVFTKQEIVSHLDELFNKIVGSSPETLDTLKELAEALGNDPNFATTILEKLSEKADKTEITRLEEVLETKVNISDYVKIGIYNTPIKTTIYDLDHYRVSVKDEKLKEYIDGMLVTIKISESNLKGPCMLQINGMEAKPILTQDQYPLIKGELKVGSIYSLRYNGGTGNFILQGKGGVNLHNTTQTEYFAYENIIRGELLDFVNNNTVRLSIPRFKVLSTYISNDTKFNCDGKIKTIALTEDKFITIWKDGTQLKAYLFTIDELTNFINGNIHSSEPMIVNLDCNEFDTVKINDNKIVINYTTIGNTVNTLIVNIIDNELVIGNIKSGYESDRIFNLVSIKTKDSRFILGYQFGDKTKLEYLQIIDNDINTLFTRTNVDYILDNHCFVNEEQILFSGSVGNTIKGWVMNINDLQFNYTTISTITTSALEDEEYTNITMTLFNDRQIYSTFTNLDASKQFNQYIEIDFNGDILPKPVSIISEDIEEISSNLIPSRIKVYDNLFIAPSNIDPTRPILDESNNKYIKLTSEKISNNKIELLETHTVIPYTYKDMSFTMLDKKTLLLTYNSRVNDSEDYKLFFNIIQIKRKPDMIAISSSNKNETVLVAEW